MKNNNNLVLENIAEPLGVLRETLVEKIWPKRLAFLHGVKLLNRIVNLLSKQSNISMHYGLKRKKWGSCRGRPSRSRFDSSLSELATY